MTTDTTGLTAEDLLHHGAWLRRLAARLVEPAAADDVVQDTWAAALASPPARDRPLRPWLGQVLRNLVRNRARGRARFAVRARRIAAADDVPLPTADELLQHHETHRMVAGLVTGLAEPFRSTVLLCYGQGVSPSEVAARQGVPAGTVRWRLKRGLDDLRVALDARYGNDRKAWTMALAPLAAGAMQVSVPAVVPWMKGVAVVAVAAAAGWWLAPRFMADAPVAGLPVEEAAVAALPAEKAAAPVAGAPPASPSAPPPAGGPVAGRALAAAAAPGPGGAPAPAVSTEQAIARAMEVGNAPTKGNPQAPVTIVAFAEFQCPFSARVQATLTELLAAYPTQVRLAFKNLPLAFHEDAALAAEAALAAGEQGKFWQMHDHLFANQSALDLKSLEAHTAALKLDVPKWRKALDSKRFRPQVEADEQQAKAAGISGTPSFLVNGKLISGAQKPLAFKEAVEEALAISKGLPPPPKTARSPASVGPVVASPAAMKRAMAAGGAPTKGPVDAPVTVVLFEDLSSPHCARVDGPVAEVLAAYPKTVRIVFRSRPIGPTEYAAAEAALAAHGQGKFWDMRGKLCGNPLARDTASIERLAAEAGLDVAKWKATLADKAPRKLVDEDFAAAEGAHVNGAPSYLINGHLLMGARPAEHVKAVVEWALARAQGKPVPPAPELPKAIVQPAVGRMGDASLPGWPPPRTAFPDDLLGERVNVRFTIGDAPTRGSAKAPVTVLYFPDLGCWYCSEGRAVVDGLLRTYGDGVRIVAIPVSTTRGPDSPERAAEIAWAAHEKGVFWDLHDRLYGGRVRNLREALGAAAEELSTLAHGGRFEERAREDLAMFQAAKLRPGAFVIDGRAADGSSALVQLVEQGLAKAGRPLPRPASGSGVVPQRLSMPQQFFLEPRDEVWASAVERDVGGLMATDLRAVARATAKLECRTSLCSLRWQTGTPTAKVIDAFVVGAYAPSGRRATTTGHVQVYFAMRKPGAGDSTAEDVVARFRKQRASRLYNLRTGRARLPEGLSVASLPPD